MFRRLTSFQKKEKKEEQKRRSQFIDLRKIEIEIIQLFNYQRI